MICKNNLDQPQVSKANLPMITLPDNDDFQSGYEVESKQKCKKVIRRYDLDPEQLKMGVMEKYLGDDGDDEGTEEGWFLRQCCAKTANFPRDVFQEPKQF